MERKIKVVICSGTACYVMGGSDLLLLEDSLPPELRDRVSVEGANCLGLCKEHRESKAPFVTVDGETVAGATIPEVIEKIREKLNA